MPETINKQVTSDGKQTVRKSVELSPDAEEALKSALTAGYVINPGDQVDGQALKLESLDQDIKNLTYGSNDFTILPDLLNLGVTQARSTVEQYVQFLKHGKVGHQIFQPEIGIGSVNSPDMKKQRVNLKFLVDVKQASFAIQVAATVEDAQKINEEDAMVVIGKTIEWATFFGDADLTAGENGDGLEFDGLEKLIPASRHLDLRGGSLTPEVLNKAAVLIGKGFGVATDAYMPIGVKADFGNQFLGAQRVIVPTNDGTTAGVNVDHFLSARGNIRLNGSTIMDADDLLDESETINPKAPAAPTVTAKVNTNAGGQWSATALTTDQGAEIQPAEVGHEFSYKVVAVGHDGDSLPSDAVTATPANATDGVELDISLSAMQREIPDYVAIYRQTIVDGDENYYLIDRVASREINDSGVISFVDLNATMAGPTGAKVFVGELRHNVIDLMQFIPMSKINLAVVTTATSFAVLTSVALRLSIPNRWVEIHNVRYNNMFDNHMEGVNLKAFVGNK